MAFVNYNNKEITVKIVYYGPALSGKTTCLKYIYASKEFVKKGKLITLDTDGDRTLFFDFLPLEIGKLGDYSIKIQLYTVPGQVSYDTTRKVVLQGADGIVFVADSQVVVRQQNIDSLENLKKNLELNNISFTEIPVIFQYNKRDLREILPVDDLNDDLNPENKSFFPTVATSGENIFEALHAIMKLVILYLKNKLTIFRKDKTVMFSREEITSTDSAKDETKSEIENSEKIPQEGISEEIFELSSPIEDKSNVSGESPSGNSVFNLDDANLLDSKDLDLEIPEVELDQQLSVESKLTETPDKFIEDRIAEPNQGSDSNSGSRVRNIEIPVEIKIPEDNDEIRINLNLKIILKRK